MRRLIRLTNGFSKKITNHAHMVTLCTVFHDFIRIRKTLKVTRAMELGLSDEVRDFEWISGLIGLNKPAPKKREPYKKKSIS